MCDPISLTTLAITTASTALTFKGQQEQAAQMNKASQTNAANTAASTNDQYNQVRLRQLQEGEALTGEKQQVAEETRAAQATAAVAAGTAGVSGNSVRGLIRDFRGRQGRYNASVDTQRRWNDQQTEQSLTGIQSQGQSQINSIQTVAPPSFFDAALRIAGAGAGAYAGYDERQNR